ncbi:MAG TPA: hypothetical protein VHI13_02080 [Candidatus Kapabacteria bacterium]|nr:hypothetical protein [Candidatus Kapabacteria bacterium]
MADNLKFSRVIYDPGTLHAEWVATIPPHFTGFRVTLRAAGSAPRNFQTQVPNITIHQSLEPAVGHTLTITVMAGGRPTAQTATVDLITAAPVMTLVDNSGADVRYDWTAAPGPVQGYIAILTQTGGGEWTVRTDAATLTATFDRHLSSTAAYTSMVRATNAGGVVLGPSSDVLVPLTTTPTDPTVAAMGTQMIVGWITEVNPEVTSYVADLLANGASVGTRQAQGPPAIYEPALVAGTIYTATVRSAGAKVLGPWVPHVAGPYTASAVLAYDAFGRVETITWSSSGSIAYDYEETAAVTSARTVGA